MLTLLSLTACVLTMVSSFFVACGKLKAVYVLGILNGASYVVLNAILASKGDEQAGVLFLVVPSAWGMLMSCVGLWRLRRAR